MRGDMHREDLMGSDMLSEILLSVSGVVLFLPLVLMLVYALAHAF